MITIDSQELDYTLSLKEGWCRSVEAPARSQPPTMTLRELQAMRDDERAHYEELRSVWHANLGE